MLSILKHNSFIIPALIILPCGYYAGINFREFMDERSTENQQKSEAVRHAKLREQREAILEERRAILEKIQQAKNETE
ncbi:hypothetical protein BDF14DRAFT_1761864 [Spinellus fusiger]|nr:hypothetical protein BDF14DRAFT_1761864 [Spinellus fusiger]